MWISSPAVYHGDKEEQQRVLEAYLHGKECLFHPGRLPRGFTIKDG